MDRSALPQATLEHYERELAGRHLVHGSVAHWARVKPDTVALINADRGRQLTWRELDEGSTALAAALLAAGFGKGDYLATSLPFLTELVLLELACFKVGVIHAPLDLRLTPAEVIRSLTLIRAKGFAFLGVTPMADFRELGKAVRGHCTFVSELFQLSPPGEEVIDGARSFAAFAATAPSALASGGAALAGAIAAVSENDGAQVIFTTGSTGSPKPALLSHRGITAQNYALSTGLGFDEATRMLVNLPPSHVGGQAEMLLTTLFGGGTAVMLEIFDPTRTLRAVQEHGVTLLGQIPAMFNLEWRLPTYSEFNLSSIQLAAYGGQQVARPFLEKLATMAPSIATGLGLTEASGFCTYTPPGAGIDEIAASLGHAMPIYPMSIRAAMDGDGRAGAELPDGELGNVCFRGPQTFLGYVNDPAATAKAVSTDGWLYTADLGFVDAAGLHFAGRARWVIKPAGYQVFPGDVEAALAALDDRVGVAGVVGAPHRVRSEGIVAFVEPRPGATLDADELKRRARSLGMMRPSHVVIVEPGKLPLNRVGKVDYVRLSEMALAEVEALRARRRWDR